VTATAAANGYQQRSATTRNTRATGDNSTYVTPEEQTVGIEAAPPTTAGNTAAKPLDTACGGQTAVECRPSARTRRMALDDLPIPTEQKVVPVRMPDVFAER
jgi:hypothetical protein